MAATLNVGLLIVSVVVVTALPPPPPMSGDPMGGSLPVPNDAPGAGNVAGWEGQDTNTPPAEFDPRTTTPGLDPNTVTPGTVPPEGGRGSGPGEPIYMPEINQTQFAEINFVTTTVPSGTVPTEAAITEREPSNITITETGTIEENMPSDYMNMTSQGMPQDVSKGKPVDIPHSGESVFIDVPPPPPIDTGVSVQENVLQTDIAPTDQYMQAGESPHTMSVGTTKAELSTPVESSQSDVRPPESMSGTDTSPASKQPSSLSAIKVQLGSLGSDSGAGVPIAYGLSNKVNGNKQASLDSTFLNTQGAGEGVAAEMSGNVDLNTIALDKTSLFSGLAMRGNSRIGSAGGFNIPADVFLEDPKYQLRTGKPESTLTAVNTISIGSENKGGGVIIGGMENLPPYKILEQTGADIKHPEQPSSVKEQTTDSHLSSGISETSSITTISVVGQDTVQTSTTSQAILIGEQAPTGTMDIMPDSKILSTGVESIGATQSVQSGQTMTHDIKTTVDQSVQVPKESSVVSSEMGTGIIVGGGDLPAQTQIEPVQGKGIIVEGQMVDNIDTGTGDIGIPPPPERVPPVVEAAVGVQDIGKSSDVFASQTGAGLVPGGIAIEINETGTGSTVRVGDVVETVTDKMSSSNIPVSPIISTDPIVSTDLTTTEYPIVSPDSIVSDGIIQGKDAIVVSGRSTPQPLTDKATEDLGLTEITQPVTDRATTLTEVQTELQTSVVVSEITSTQTTIDTVKQTSVPPVSLPRERPVEGIFVHAMTDQPVTIPTTETTVLTVSSTGVPVGDPSMSGSQIPDVGVPQPPVFKAKTEPTTATTDITTGTSPVSDLPKPDVGSPQQAVDTAGPDVKVAPDTLVDRPAVDTTPTTPTIPTTPEIVTEKSTSLDTKGTEKQVIVGAVGTDATQPSRTISTSDTSVMTTTVKKPTTVPRVTEKEIKVKIPKEINIQIDPSITQDSTRQVTRGQQPVTGEQPSQIQPNASRQVSRTVEEVTETVGPALESLCVNSVFIDAIGYNTYPGFCNKVVQCFQYQGRHVAVLRDCPAGYFWHQEQALCRQPAEVPCYDDPCLNFGVYTYNRTGGCASFYTCEYGISIPTCCKRGFRFNGADCVQDTTCTDPCITPQELESQLRYAACKFLPDEHNPYGYITMEHNGLRIRACPRGTVFSARQCGCTRVRGQAGRRRMQSCSPQFFMNFNRGFQELSGSNMASQSDNVVINTGAAEFDGTGRITIWGYMDRELGDKFAIRMRFKVNGNKNGYQSIVSNCGMTGAPTVEIALHNGKLRFLAKSKEFAETTVVNKAIDPYRWNEVIYMYDGLTFRAGVNGDVEQVPLGGYLEKKSNPFLIGGCPRPDTGFHGLIDSVAIYTNCIPRDLFANGR